MWRILFSDRKAKEKNGENGMEAGVEERQGEDKRGLASLNVSWKLANFLVAFLGANKCHASFLPSSPDVGFPSVCYKYVLLSLINKEYAFGQWHNRT